MIDSFDYKSWKEELWNAITHGIGFIASIPALVVLLLTAVQTGNALHITTFSIFGASVIILFLMSTLLHSMPEKYKHFFAILDHSSIYILIAGTSPTALNAKIVSEINTAGKIKRHGAFAIALLPSEAIVPHEAVGAGTPRPR